MLPFFRRRKSLLTILVMAAIILIGWIVFLRWRERSIAEAIGLAMQIR